jgi:hypothetical protein
LQGSNPIPHLEVDLAFPVRIALALETGLEEPENNLLVRRVSWILFYFYGPFLFIFGYSSSVQSQCGKMTGLAIGVVTMNA